MSEEEAQDVVRLHFQREESNRVSIADVAEAIHTSEDEVRRLLSEVREIGKTDVAQGLVTTRSKASNRMLLATLLAAFVICVAFTLTLWKRSVRQHAATPVAASTYNRSEFLSTK